MAAPVRILLVDDRPENLVALRAALEPEGYFLEDALSGQEACRLAEEYEFAAILLDVQMPIMDGFETARRLRLSSRARHYPIIFVTAIDRTDAYEQEGYGAGAVDYLFKPLNIDILRAKLKIFASLQRQREDLARQAQLLREHAVREKETELLRETLRQRDEFLSMASHELRTPITPLALQLQAFLALLDHGSLRDADPERLRRMLEISCAQVERMARLTNELLDAGRISTGRFPLSFRPTALAPLLEKVLTSHRAEADRAGCRLVTKLADVPAARADAFRTEQVLINLLTNAFSYAPGTEVSVRLYAEGGEVALEVCDGGPGISADDQARIFGRYERATSARHHGGLGLGLYIASEIMRRHGGSLTLRSEPGAGACFTARFARAREEETGAELAPSL